MLYEAQYCIPYTPECRPLPYVCHLSAGPRDLSATSFVLPCEASSTNSTVHSTVHSTVLFTVHFWRTMVLWWCVQVGGVSYVDNLDAGPKDLNITTFLLPYEASAFNVSEVQRLSALFATNALGLDPRYFGNFSVLSLFIPGTPRAPLPSPCVILRMLGGCLGSVLSLYCTSQGTSCASLVSSCVTRHMLGGFGSP